MVILSSFIFSWAVAGYLSRPAKIVIGQSFISHKYENIELRNGTGKRLKGWLFEVNAQAPAVVLFHGVGSNRKQMQPRAYFLIKHGYNVLLIDLQAHGESQGDLITFGLYEADDARTAIKYLKKRYPGNKIAALGVSLGGAACVLGDKPLDVNALIIEAVYANIYEAIKNRLEIKLGKYSRWLSVLLSIQFKLRFNIDPEKLRPEIDIKKYTGPLLLIAGETDRHTKVAESRRLFRNANSPKQLWLVKNAAHVDFHRFDKASYEKKILSFLNKYLN